MDTCYDPAKNRRNIDLHGLSFEDADTLAAYRATGKGWQTRINALLREHMPQE